MLTIGKICLSEEDVIDAIADLEKDIFSDPWSRKEIENTIKQKQTFCVAAREEDQVLGYFLCYYVLDECEIARIAVRQDARRRGIGKSLFSHMEELCREKQICHILLDVRESNEPAISFYKHQGFAIDGIRKNFYGGERPEHAILMSKHLLEDFV